MKSVFLDTNVYLHYQLFDQINWLEIIDAESLTIVVPPVTVRELNKHKDSHTQPRVKKRAGEVLKKLHALFDSDSVTCLRGGVDIRLEDRDPAVDFAAYQLCFDIQDDQLIASMIMHRDENPQAEVALVTSDAGLVLVAKARRFGILTIKMPENLRVAEQPDPSQQRINDLERELRELKARMPCLSLAFEDGKQHRTFKLNMPPDLEPDRLERQLNDIKQKYPKKERAQPSLISGQPLHSQEFMAAMGSMSLVSQEEITRYNTELEKFYQEYDRYLQSSIQTEKFKSRAIELVIWLVNDGTAPAEDIDIFLHFPNGLTVLEAEDLPESPGVPKPPVEPRTALQMLTEPFTRMVEIPYVGSFASGRIAPPPNVSAPSIERTDSYDVSFHVLKAKHNLRESLEPLYAVFDSFEEARSFHIEYHIYAADVPHEITGKLHVVVEKVGSGP